MGGGGGGQYRRVEMDADDRAHAVDGAREGGVATRESDGWGGAGVGADVTLSGGGGAGGTPNRESDGNGRGAGGTGGSNGRDSDGAAPKKQRRRAKGCKQKSSHNSRQVGRRQQGKQAGGGEDTT